MPVGARKVIYGDDDLVLAELRLRVRERGAARQLAEEAGVSAAAVSQVIRGHRPPPESLARVLGFRKVVRWERTELVE
jgi:transcriptional regulator with XRE-family HTH domain